MSAIDYMMLVIDIRSGCCNPCYGFSCGSFDNRSPPACAKIGVLSIVLAILSESKMVGPLGLA